jgi:protoheme IX farnesyltransferase
MTDLETLEKSPASPERGRGSVYLELIKPRIVAMVVLTVLVGYLAVTGLHDFETAALLHVVIGTCLSCSGAGALNQYLERNSDGLMARTRFRPLPAQLISEKSGMAFGVITSVTGVGYLLAFVNPAAALINTITLVSYVAIYTPLKKSSSLSTLIGAIPGALPPVIGCAAAGDALGRESLLLFSILFLWQVPHFLAIGLLHRDDYRNAGFPTLLGIDRDGSASGRQMVLYSAALLPVTLAVGSAGYSGPVFFASALVLGLAYLAASVSAAKNPSQLEARRLLLCSVAYLPLLLASYLLDRVAT